MSVRDSQATGLYRYESHYVIGARASPYNGIRVDAHKKEKGPAHRSRAGSCDLHTQALSILIGRVCRVRHMGGLESFQRETNGTDDTINIIGLTASFLEEWNERDGSMEAVPPILPSPENVITIVFDRRPE